MSRPTSKDRDTTGETSAQTGGKTKDAAGNVRPRRPSGRLIAQTPHSQALGMHFVEAGDGHATLRVPYAPHLVGNPETGVIHGGVITSTLDNAAGIAVHSALDARVPIATLDLRIDYMKPATPHRDFYASAHCYKVTRSIAFVRGAAYHESEDDPIATATATFMLSSSAPKTETVPAQDQSTARD